MQKSSLYSIGLLFMVVIGLFSCSKKNNGIDNNQIIETPYSIFFSDSSGAVYKSNDGKTDTNIFKADGYPCRAICTMNGNIFLVKDQLYVSTNNGQNFSLSSKLVSQFTTKDCDSNVVTLNQSMIINLPTWYRLYVVSDDPSSADYLGQQYSTSGLYGSWFPDGSYDNSDSLDPGVGALPVQMRSYTQLADGTVAGLAVYPPTVTPAPDTIVYRNFYNNTTVNVWKECTGDQNGAPRNRTGSELPGTGFFTLGHLNNRLIAIDGTCAKGAWYSDDTGRTWAQYAGIPANTSLLSICSPFEENCFIGSKSGLYVLNQNTGTFELNTNGLTSNLIVRGITYKQNVYKTGTTQKFIYLATNKGIYQSVDGGNNWILTIQGNFTAIY